MPSTWTHIFSKVKAALGATLVIAILALIDQLTALELTDLGPWAIPAAAFIAAGAAYLKKEVAGWNFDEQQPPLPGTDDPDAIDLPNDEVEPPPPDIITEEELHDG